MTEVMKKKIRKPRIKRLVISLSELLWVHHRVMHVITARCMGLRVDQSL